MALKEATQVLREQNGLNTLQFENSDLHSLRHTCLTGWAWTHGHSCAWWPTATWQRP